MFWKSASFSSSLIEQAEANSSIWTWLYGELRQYRFWATYSFHSSYHCKNSKEPTAAIGMLAVACNFAICNQTNQFRRENRKGPLSWCECFTLAVFLYSSALISWQFHRGLLEEWLQACPSFLFVLWSQQRLLPRALENEPVPCYDSPFLSCSIRHHLDVHSILWCRLTQWGHTLAYWEGPEQINSPPSQTVFSGEMLTDPHCPREKACSLSILTEDWCHSGPRGYQPRPSWLNWFMDLSRHLSWDDYAGRSLCFEQHHKGY